MCIPLIGQTVGIDEGQAEIELVGGAADFALEAAHGVDGIGGARGGVVVCFGQGRDKAGFAGAGQRDHGEAVRERQQFAGRLVRRMRRRDEVDFVETEAALGGASHGQVTFVDGVEGAAEDTDHCLM